MEKKAEINQQIVKKEVKTLSSSEEDLDSPPPLVHSKFVTEPRDSFFSSSEENIPDLVRRSNSYSSESGDEICRETITIQLLELKKDEMKQKKGPLKEVFVTAKDEFLDDNVHHNMIVPKVDIPSKRKRSASQDKDDEKKKNFKKKKKVAAEPKKTVCTLCMESFEQHEFRRHNKLRHDHKCDEKGCVFVLESEQSLQKHKASVHKIHPSSKYREICGECGKMMTLKIWEIHKETPHPHKCKDRKCDMKFIKIQELEKHLKIHSTSIKNGTLSKNSKKTQSNISKPSPVPSSVKNRRKSLTPPDKSVPSQEKKRRKSSTPPIVPDPKYLKNRRKSWTPPLIDEYWMCWRCMEPLTTEEKLKEHSLKDHKHSCDQDSCQKCFVSFSSLSKHKFEAHNIKKNLRQCEKCKEMIDTKSLKTHLARSHDVPCSFPDCDFQSNEQDVWIHKIFKHKIGECKNPLDEFVPLETVPLLKSAEIDELNNSSHKFNIENSNKIVNPEILKFEKFEDEKADEPMQNSVELNVEVAQNEFEVEVTSQGKSNDDLRHELEKEILGVVEDKSPTSAEPETSSQLSLNSIHDCLPLNEKIKDVHEAECNFEECQSCNLLIPIKNGKFKAHSKLKHTHPCQDEGCSLVFSKEIERDQHMYRYHDILLNEDRYLVCPKCSHLFTKLGEVARHKTHVKQGHHDTCQKCELQFNLYTRGLFEHHVKFSHSSQDLLCPFCDMSFIPSDHLRYQKHISKEHNVGPCPHCPDRNLMFVTRERLNYHLKECHPEATGDCDSVVANLDSIKSEFNIKTEDSYELADNFTVDSSVEDITDYQVVSKVEFKPECKLEEPEMDKSFTSEEGFVLEDISMDPPMDIVDDIPEEDSQEPFDITKNLDKLLLDFSKQDESSSLIEGKFPQESKAAEPQIDEKDSLTIEVENNPEADINGKVESLASFKDKLKSALSSSRDNDSSKNQPIMDCSAASSSSSDVRSPISFISSPSQPSSSSSSSKEGPLLFSFEGSRISKKEEVSLKAFEKSSKKARFIIPRKEKVKTSNTDESSKDRKVNHEVEVYNKFEKKLASSLNQEAVRQEPEDVDHEDTLEIKPVVRQGKPGRKKPKKQRKPFVKDNSDLPQVPVVHDIIPDQVAESHLKDDVNLDLSLMLNELESNIVKEEEGGQPFVKEEEESVESIRALIQNQEEVTMDEDIAVNEEINHHSPENERRKVSTERNSFNSSKDRYDDIDDLLGDSDEEMETKPTREVPPPPIIAPKDPLPVASPRDSSKKKPPFFLCPECNQNFGKNESQFNVHRNQIHAFPCKYCPLKFTYANGKEEHQNKEHIFEMRKAQQSLHCDKCGSSFNRQKSFERHNLQVHRHPCEYCEFVFINEHELETHLDNVHGEKKMKKSKTKLALSTGFGNALDAMTVKKPTAPRKPKNHLKKALELSEDDSKCEQCGQKFMETETFQLHIEQDHNFLCFQPDCDMSFIHEYYLHLHESEVHKTREPPDVSNKPDDDVVNVKDPSPSKSENAEDADVSSSYSPTFNSSHNHSLDESFNLNSSLFNCDECHMSFSSGDQLADHESLHYSPEPVKINPKPAGANNVKSSHKQALLFPCTAPQCNKSYESMDKLIKHQKDKHERRCKDCNKQFPTEKKFREHRNIRHKFRCTQCSRAYQLEADLLHHMQKHQDKAKRHEVKGFNCQKCDEKFYDLQAFKMHGIEPHNYSCFMEDCVKSFSTKSKLEGHLTQKHKVLHVQIDNLDTKGIITTEKSQSNKDIAEWAESWISCQEAKDHMRRVMKARTASRRHNLFLDKKERERCSGSETSRLYQLSNPGFLGGGGEKDTVVIRQLIDTVFNVNFHEADPKLRELGIDSAFVYTSCVLFPETFIHQHQTQGKSREEAEQAFMEVAVDVEERQGLSQEIQEAVRRNRREEAGDRSGDEWVDHSDMEDCD